MKPTKTIELLLWKQLKQGDTKALGKLYDRYADSLFTYGSQFSSDRALVLDAIHDVFLNLYKYRKNLADTDSVEYYLMRSLKNCVLKSVKAKQSARVLNETNLNTVSETTFEDKLIGSEIQKEYSYKLTKAMGNLSKKQRKSLFLRFTEGYSYDEIAELMNISVQSARTNIYRSIKTLRQNLQTIFLLF